MEIELLAQTRRMDQQERERLQERFNHFPAPFFGHVKRCVPWPWLHEPPHDHGATQYIIEADLLESLWPLYMCNRHGIVLDEEQLKELKTERERLLAHPHLEGARPRFFDDTEDK